MIHVDVEKSCLGIALVMADAFLIKKWNRVFYMFFDQDRNKVLEWEDFELLIKKISEHQGTGGGSQMADKTAQSLKEVWQSLTHLADVNSDNMISIEEWQIMWQNALDGKSKPKWEEVYLDTMFKLMDASDDGILDEAEYISVMSMYGISGAEAEAAFDKFAYDEKGKPVYGIDEARFRKLWDEYFLSDNPCAPGTYLFGIPD